MSRETTYWLNNNVLVGFTDKRGTAWHYRASDQGIEPNHYAGAIPVDDVRRRLFNWEPVELPMYVRIPCEIADADGMLDDGTPVVTRQVPNSKAIARSDTHEILGRFRDGYQPHSYQTWLLDSVADILDADLHIGSAGLLRGGAVAWVSVEMADNVVTPEGMTFRPYLLATTSLDGTISTTYKRCCTFVVCDNTRDAALAENTQQVKVRHSRYSSLKLGEARASLDIVHSIADDMTAEIARLARIDVPDRAFDRFVDLWVPIPKGADKGQALAAATRAQATRDELRGMYRRDDRVAPWQGTALGVSQLVNTWRQHNRPTRKTGMVERTSLDLLTGKTGAADAQVLDVLGKVLATV